MALCTNMNCLVAISNDTNIYKLDIIVDSKLAILVNEIYKKYKFI